MNILDIIIKAHVYLYSMFRLKVPIVRLAHIIKRDHEGNNTTKLNFHSK